MCIPTNRRMYEDKTVWYWSISHMSFTLICRHCVIAFLLCPMLKSAYESCHACSTWTAVVTVLRHKEEVQARPDKQTESGFQLSTHRSSKRLANKLTVQYKWCKCFLLGIIYLFFFWPSENVGDLINSTAILEHNTSSKSTCATFRNMVRDVAKIWILPVLFTSVVLILFNDLFFSFSVDKED